jgi:signal transduction histidine kinase
MMSPGEFQSFRNAYHFHRRMAWLAYGALVGISGLGLALFLFSQQRERIQADHLASLAHSLKTPLAVLRSRCDTVLNEDLGRATRQSHLLQIGSEISQLTRLLERGLEQTRPGSQQPSGDLIDSAFFEDLDEELTPAFEARGRQLEVYGANIQFHAPASSLRTALVTLLENALLHGDGTVELRAEIDKGHITLCVQDEGPGLPLDIVQALSGGSTFKTSAPGTAPSPGQHLGLIMLRNLARNEGWGLRLENLEPGFKACLEILG